MTSNKYSTCIFGMLSQNVHVLSLLVDASDCIEDIYTIVRQPSGEVHYLIFILHILQYKYHISIVVYLFI